jgi:hypothetical protein
MGMFDDLRCQYPLSVEGANALGYQTKDLLCVMDQYELRVDGTLWHEEYDTRVEESPEAFFGVWLHRDNKRWEQVRLTGEVRFYASLGGRGGMPECGWIEWSAYFKDGGLQQLNLVTHELPHAVAAVDPHVDSNTGKPTTRVEESS